MQRHDTQHVWTIVTCGEGSTWLILGTLAVSIVLFLFEKKSGESSEITMGKC